MAQISQINTCKKGSALVFSLIILFFLLVSALSVATVSVTEKRALLSSNKTNVAFQVADSGIEMVLQKVYKSTPAPATLNALAAAIGAGVKCDDTGSYTTISFNAAQGKVIIAFYKGVNGTDLYTGSCTATDWLNDVNKIKSTGMYGNTVRSVEVGLSLTPP